MQPTDSKAQQVIPAESSKHVDVAMGEVDELDDAVDQGVTQGDQGIHAAQDQPENHLLNNCPESDWRSAASSEQWNEA